MSLLNVSNTERLSLIFEKRVTEIVALVFCLMLDHQGVLKR